MKAKKLTDKTADEIIALMQKYTEKEVSFRCSAAVLNGHSEKGNEKGWHAQGLYCYRYATNILVGSAHPDHFGIIYQGWGGKVNTQGFGQEAMDWLVHLLDPEGPFQDVLPFLYHKTAEECMADRGFVIQNAMKCNPGLLWTFLQATRIFFENPGRMERFQYLRSQLPQYPSMATTCFLTIQPMTYKLDDLWGQVLAAHGEPLGSCGATFGRSFLARDYSKIKCGHYCSRSYKCYVEDADRPSNNTLPGWIDYFKGVK